MSKLKGISLLDLFKIEDLQRLQDLFADANEVASLITYPDGTPITKPSNFTRYCLEIIRKTEQGCANCKKSDSIIGTYNPNGPTIQLCLSGKLWDAGVPISIGNNHLGNWLIGQVKSGDLDEQEYIDYAQEIGADKHDLKNALDEIPTMSVDRFTKIAKMLDAFVKELTENANHNLQLTTEIAKREKIAKKLAKRERIYSAVLEASPDDITITDFNGNIKIISPAALKMFGYAHFSANKKVNISNFVIPSDKERLASDLKLLIYGIDIPPIEYKGVKKDGQVFSIEVNSQLIANKQGKSNEILFIVRDISQRKIVEEQLKEREGQFRAISEYSFNSICIINTSGKIHWVNDAMVEMSGYSKEIIYNSDSFLQFLAPESVEYVVSNFTKFVNGESYNHHYFLTIISNNGTKILCEKYMSDYTNQNGEKNLIISMMDITEQKKAEVMLTESEEKHRILFKDSPDSYFIFRDGIIIDCNRASEEILRGDRIKILGLSPSDLSPEFQPDGSKSSLKADEMIAIALTKGKHTFEWMHRRFDGTNLLVEISLVTIIIEQKLALFATWRDITIKKEQEIALQESERSKSVLLSNLPGMVYRCKFDRDWTMLFVSDQCYALTEYRKEDLIGNKATSFNELILPNYQEYLWEKWNEAVKNKQSVNIEYEIKTASSGIKWVWEQGIPIYDIHGNVEALEGFIIDITKRKHLEEKLKEDEAQYRNLANSGVALIWKSGIDKMCYYFNEPWLKFTGRTLEQEIGNGWTDGVYAGDYNRRIEKYITAFDKKEPFSMEYRLKNANGDYRWILDIGTPNYSYNKEFIGYIGHCIDITDRINSEEELKIKNEELFKSNAEKDKFFSIIAHDLRSPFNGFLGLTQILADDLPNLSQEETISYAESLKSSAINLYNLLENLLEWARMKRGLIGFYAKPINVKLLINNVILPLSEVANKKHVTIQNNATPITLVADEYMISSAIRNIVSNAIKYCNTNGIIEVSTVINKDMVEIRVSDNGIGMSPNLVKNLFNIGAQINRKGTNGEPSSGLGLILCNDFIKQHKGTISVDSQEGVGSTFIISIPNF